MGITQRTGVRYEQQLGGRFIPIAAVFQQYNISASIAWSDARRTICRAHLMYVSDATVVANGQRHLNLASRHAGHVTTHLNYHNHPSIKQ